MPNQFLSPEGDLENYFITEYWLIDQYVGDTLWTWGRNADGQLAVNTLASTSYTPVTTFVGGANWKQVACGNVHTAAIKTDGTLWTWGSNLNGQLGDNTTTQRSTPVTTFVGGTNWKQVSCAYYYTAAIKTDGTLWTWGFNSYGQLGINNTPQVLVCTPVTTFTGGTNWKQVAGGRSHTAAIKTDGTLWTWGNNTNGQLGTNDTTQRPTPVTTFAGGTNWKQVAGGYFDTAAIKTDGTLWTWGRNADGELGINVAGTTTSRTTPVTTFAGGTNWKQVSCGGYKYTVAIKTDGTLWGWGNNAYGQIANANYNPITPVTIFAGGTNWKQVSCGLRHTAAIKTDGTLWTWGSNSYGQLGSAGFAGGTNWKQVASGHYHTAAVTSGTDPTYFIS
jgi:hypothetical protein